MKDAKFRIATSITIGIICTVIFGIVNNISFRYEPLENLGILFTLFLITVIIPFGLSGIVFLIAKLLKKKGKKSFLVTLVATQIIAVAFILFSLYGTILYKKHNKERIPNIGLIENNIAPIYISSDKKISKKYIEVKIPSDWDYKDLPLLSGQLYNFEYYNNNSAVRISAIYDISDQSLEEYYALNSFMLFNEMKIKMSDFTIEKEYLGKFNGVNAHYSIYRATFQNVDVYGCTIFFRLKSQLIGVSSMSTARIPSINNIKILNTNLIIKECRLNKI